jgi:aryl-alcohol dehydrogenase-like predicted oxidoreductase
MEIAKEAGMSPVTLATAWSKQHDFVASTIVGVSTVRAMRRNLRGASELVLSDDVMKAIHKVTKEILYPMG